MKVARSSIRLAPAHPSLLLTLPPESIDHAPLILNTDHILVDGYRRFLIRDSDELDAVIVDVPDVFAAAQAMNLRTRAWDELDCFLWFRWAQSLGATVNLPVMRFAPELESADDSLLKLLASRTLTLRQAVLILQSPLPYRPFFQRLLSESIQLNNNETAAFFMLCADLKKILKLNRIEDVVAHVGAGSPEQSPRDRGVLLLKGMRVLRYPYYQRKLTEFSSNWQELNLGRHVQVNKAQFLERGKLEITLTSSSYQEMVEVFEKLSRSLDSSEWKKIWEE